MSGMDTINALMAERAARRRWLDSGQTTDLHAWLKATGDLDRSRQAQAQRRLVAYQVARCNTRQIAQDYLCKPSTEVASRLAGAIAEQGRLRRLCGLAPIAVPDPGDLDGPISLR